MTEAYVFDALRTPRGKGKKDGSLFEVKPINLLAGLLTDLQQRHQFDTSQVDDVVMGVVSPARRRLTPVNSSRRWFQSNGKRARRWNCSRARWCS